MCVSVGREPNPEVTRSHREPGTNMPSEPRSCFFHLNESYLNEQSWVEEWSRAASEQQRLTAKG